MKRYLTGILCGILVVALTAYVALDTFVLSSGYQTMQKDVETAFSAARGNLTASTQQPLSTMQAETWGAEVEGEPETAAPSAGEPAAQASSSEESAEESAVQEAAVQETETAVPEAAASSNAPAPNADSSYESYSDENITITLEAYTYCDTQVYVADVTVSSAEYLKTAFAADTYGRNITARTSEIAADNGAILAVNGDYYGTQETGYVIRNGIIYRDTAGGAEDILCIYADGTMDIQNTAEVTAQELVDRGVWQVLSFGPALIRDGAVAVTEDDEVGKARASNPRTAIGIVDTNHYLFVVSDGRTDESAGLSLMQLAEFLQSLGASTAYNLDGGGSSTMYYRGLVINNPTTSGTIKERSISDIVYIG